MNFNIEEEKIEKKSNLIGVYAKFDEEGYIIDINSDIFIENFDNWIKIDEGYGDKYAHAQNQYFDKAIINDEGKFYIRIS